MFAEEESSSVSTAFLALGSNQGHRWGHLRAGFLRLKGRDDVAVVEGSPVYETEAHTARPGEHQPSFLNAVVRVETTRTPEELLRIAHEIEHAEGRERGGRRWAPRPLDIDLLVYGGEVRDENDLTLPHPRLDRRRFVLRPWADIAPNFVVPPPFEQSVQALLDQCPDTGSIKRTDHEFNGSASAPPKS